MEGVAADGNRRAARSAHRPAAPARRHRIGGRSVHRGRQSAAAPAMVPSGPVRSERLAPRHRRTRSASATCPLTTRRHSRYGTRERVLDVAGRHPDLLTISLNTRGDARAARRQSTRVRRRGPQGSAPVSRAPDTESGSRRAGHRLRVARGDSRGRDVQLAATADAVRHRTSRRAARAPHSRAGGAAGRRPQPAGSLRDERRLPDGLSPNGTSTRACTFGSDDAAYREWRTRRTGLYATNGSVLTVFTRSSKAGALPDLFCMALLARFDGYKPGYSADFGRERNFLSWVDPESAHEEHRRPGHPAQR